MTCETCGAVMAVGAWPFCPHGAGHNNVIGDEIDLWQENGPPQPIHFRSRIERKRWMKEHGFRDVAKNAGPDDKHCPRWITMDARTLENATILVSRQNSVKSHPHEAPIKMRIRYVSGEGIG